MAIMPVNMEVIIMKKVGEGTIPMPYPMWKEMHDRVMDSHTHYNNMKAILGMQKRKRHWKIWTIVSRSITVLNRRIDNVRGLDICNQVL